jgi:hypothetical protein
MAKNFAAVLESVAEFLDYRLTGAEVELITEKCSFKYMKENEELFEMAPPNMFSVIGGHFLASGKTDRHLDVTPAIRQRILDYCRQSLLSSNYPAGGFYPDLAVPISLEVNAIQTESWSGDLSQSRYQRKVI